MRRHGQSVNASVLVKELAEKIRDAEKLLHLDKVTKQIADTFAAGGRPGNAHAKAVALITAHCFWQLTGKTVFTVTKTKTIYNRVGGNKRQPPAGDYIRLLVRIFELLKVDANAEHYANLIAPDFRANLQGENSALPDSG